MNEAEEKFQLGLAAKWTALLLEWVPGMLARDTGLRYEGGTDWEGQEPDFRDLTTALALADTLITLDARVVEYTVNLRDPASTAAKLLFSIEDAVRGQNRFLVDLWDAVDPPGTLLRKRPTMPELIEDVRRLRRKNTGPRDT